MAEILDLIKEEEGLKRSGEKGLLLREEDRKVVGGKNNKKKTFFLVRGGSGVVGGAKRYKLTTAFSQPPRT